MWCWKTVKTEKKTKQKRLTKYENNFDLLFYFAHPFQRHEWKRIYAYIAGIFFGIFVCYAYGKVHIDTGIL